MASAKSGYLDLELIRAGILLSSFFNSLKRAVNKRFYFIPSSVLSDRFNRLAAAIFDFPFPLITDENIYRIGVGHDIRGRDQIPFCLTCHDYSSSNKLRQSGAIR